MKLKYLAIAAVLFTTACAGSSHNGHGQPSPVASTAVFNEADVQFAQMMIVHHRQAVEMADLAPTRAASTEIKQLAAGIRAAQQPEIDTMTSWLTEWKQPVSQDMGHEMPGLMSEMDMGKLKAATGKEFDRMFATMMIAHHQGAIQMARDLAQSGKSPEAKKLAAEIERVQLAEIAQMQGMLG